MKNARDHGHVFGEAFMLMRYACKDCGTNEMIWNSRDGITPFSIGCRTDGCSESMNHVDWQNDIYAPDFKPATGQRFFRDGTPDEAANIMQRRINTMRDQYPTTQEREAELIEGARNAAETGGESFHEFKAGWPTLDTAN